MKKTAFAIALATLGFGANAAVISFEAPLNLQVTEINQTLTLNKFDSGLGTLEAVTVEFFGQGVSGVTIQNTAAQDQSFRFSSVLDLVFTGPLADVVSIELFNTNGFISIGSGNTVDLGQVDISESLSLNVAANLFTNFIGSDLLTFQCESFVTNSQSGGGGNVIVTQNTQAGCGAKVTYSYTDNTPTNPVPEPGSLALLGLGLAGLGALRRKKA